MKILYTNNNGEQELFSILGQRNNRLSGEIQDTVKIIVDEVRQNGDSALRKYTKQFDKVDVKSFEYTVEQLNEYASKAPEKLVTVMEKATANITEYHSKQTQNGYEFSRGGRSFGRVVRPLEKVGLYVPGGTAAYPSTILMNCIPAKIAGVKDIIMVTPPKAEGLSPSIAAAAKIAGVTRVFTVGGAQAIAALAYGTETIPQVDKIVGPGNSYVAAAKRIVFGDVDIDMIAGPSEVLIIADKTANCGYIAADMLSQLEHDPAAAAILITDDVNIAEKTKDCLDDQLAKLSRREISETSAESYAIAIVCDNIYEAMRIANSVAPEHLELQCENAKELLAEVRNAGSVFLGEYTTEPLGDYYAGTNHVLPTNGSARFSSPLSVDDFVKKFSYLEYSREAFIEDSEDTIEFAEAEGLTAHANAVKIRLNKKA